MPFSAHLYRFSLNLQNSSKFYDRWHILKRVLAFNITPQFVSISFRSRKKTIPDIYICNLAVADLVHIIGMPFLIHQWARGGEWVFGGLLCTVITSLDTCNQFACSAIMTVMSIDR